MDLREGDRRYDALRRLHDHDPRLCRELVRAILESERERGSPAYELCWLFGSDAPGTILELCSPAFRRLFAGAEFIIAKGQANYESLSGTAGPIFFLLQAKCPVVARHLGAPVKSIVLTHANGTT